MLAARNLAYGSRNLRNSCGGSETKSSTDRTAAMFYFLRKLSNNPSLIGAVAFAASGAGIHCFTSSINDETSTTISLSPPLPDSLRWPWKNLQFNSFHRAPISFISSQNDATRGVDINNGTGKDADYVPKHNCNCLNVDTIANAAAKVGPAVVHLSVLQGFQGIIVGKNTGSGTIIDENGTILTCAHVVVDFQGRKTLSKVEVRLQDGRTFDGTVVNADLHSDIALVKINSKTPLPTAKFGSSSKLRPGEWVVAMGCPLTLQNTVTAGIVSCVDRKSNDLGLGGLQREYLQTDCAINQGNSGGPLVNINGEIIGVNKMKVVGADGLNFAVPIDSVITIIEHFERNGRVIRTWLGMKMIDLNDMIVAHVKDKKPSFPNVVKGVLIASVYPGSPADRAGFYPGDVIVEFGGKLVGTVKEIIDIVADKIGKPFVAVVKRENDVTAVLTVIPEEADLET